MATQKPISTISYNSEGFLKEKLETWYKAHIIQAYMYIKHKGEDGDKDHIHVYLEPNKRIDPMDLKHELREFDVKHPDKPFGVRPFRPSVEEDWILYDVHDPDYLKMKYGGGEKGEKIPYKWQDIVASEGYDVEVAFIRAKAKMEHTSANLVKRLQSGENAMNLVLSGENPFMVNALLRACTMTEYEKLLRERDDLLRRVQLLEYAILNEGYSIKEDGSEIKLERV